MVTWISDVHPRDCGSSQRVESLENRCDDISVCGEDWDSFELSCTCPDDNAPTNPPTMPVMMTILVAAAASQQIPLSKLWTTESFP
jgi:hypothetical protein